MRVSERTAFAVAVTVLISLNFLTLVQAYPETFRLDGGCCVPPAKQLAKDFSAYYTAVWRLFHNPGQIYTRGYVDDGEYHILPQPQPYKYLPSFLFIVSPFTLLQYHDGLITFDAFQFLLLPFMAFLLYRITKGHSLRTRVFLATVVLLLPLPLHVNEWSVSTSYFWQWAEGQSKVVETFFVLLMVYFARSGKPRLSGVAFGLASFDPRFAIIALPLLLGYNPKVRTAAAYGVGTLVVTNFPLLYPATMQNFLGMMLGSGLTTPVYYYAWIPILTVACLIVIDRKDIIPALKGIVRPRAPNPESKPAPDVGPR